MGQKNILFKFLSATSLLIAVFFVYQNNLNIANAWTKPSCNPPLCTGVLGGLTTGNLSIGTTNPEGLFQIASSTATDVKLVIERADMYKSAILRFNTTNAGSDWSVGLLNGGGAASNGFGISKTNLVSGAKFILTDGTFNVGIGTTNPAYKLDVVGDINFTGTFRQNGTAFSGSQWTTSGSNLYFNTGVVGIGLTSPDPNYKITTSAGGIKAESTTQPAGYFSSATGHALITGTGNVGIGITAPNAKLDVNNGAIMLGSNAVANPGTRPAISNTPVNGEINGYYYSSPAISTGFLRLSSGGIAASKTFIDLSAYNTTADLAYNIVFGTVGTERMRLSSGNLGIGTTAPTATLQVQTTDAVTNANTTVARIVHTTSGTAANGIASGLMFMANPAGTTAAYGLGEIQGIMTNASTVDTALGFSTRAASASLTEKMRIDSVGNVGIGTTAPTAKLYISGTSLSADNAIYAATNPTSGGSVAQFRLAQSSNSGGTVLKVEHNAPSNSNFNLIQASVNHIGTPEVKFLVRGDGNVGIGTTAPAYKLQVVGTLDATTITQGGLPIGAAGWTTGTGKVYTTTITDNVGIGTTAPTKKLEISGEAHPVLKLTSSSDSAYNVELQANWSANHQMGLNVMGTEILGRYIGNTALMTGSVGIGLTSPDTNYKLTTTAGGVKAENSSASQPAGYFSNASTGPSLVTGTGNVGIGTTAPTAKLEVNGSIGSINANPLWFLGPSNSTINSTNYHTIGYAGGANYHVTGSAIGDLTIGARPTGKIVFGTNSSVATPLSRMIIDASGNIGMGSDPYSYGKLTVQGRIVFGNITDSMWFYDSNRTITGAASGLGMTVGSGLALTFATSDIERMRIISGGNIGIGLTSPDTNYKITTTAGGIKAENSSATEPAGYFDNQSTGPDIQLGTGGVKFSDGSIQTTAGGGWSINAGNLYPTNLGGNVGIGTSVPQAKLEIGQSINTILGGLLFTPPAGAGQNGGWYHNNTVLVGREGGVDTIALDGGRVGIGTTLPSTYLHVYGSRSAQRTVLELGVDNVGAANNDEVSVDFKWYNGYEQARISSYTANAGPGTGGLKFYTSSTGTSYNAMPSMTLNESGNVAIGLTTPDTNYKLTTSAGGIKAENSSASQPAGYFSNASTGPALVTGTGKVGIGTTAPGYALDVNGSLRATGGSYFDSYVVMGSLVAADPGASYYGYSHRIGGVSVGISGVVGVGATSPDSNYKITTSAGGVKAENNHATNPAGYFDNLGAGPDLQVATGGIKFSDATTLASAGGVSYSTGSYLVASHDAEYMALDAAADGVTYLLMKTFRASKGGSITAKFDGYIVSGAQYWAYKFAKNNGATTLATGYYASCTDAPCSVHAYRNFSANLSGIVPGDLIELWMVSSDAGGNPTGGASQNLVAKNFRLYSGTPSIEPIATNIWGGNTGIGTTSPDTNYKLTTSAGGIKAENSSASQPAGYFSNASTGPALVTGTGKVGIGITNPGTALDVITDAATSRGVQFGYNGTTLETTIAGRTGNALNLNSAMTVTSSNVGIGLTSPDANYKITTSAGGIKAENNSATQPTAFFSNAGTGPSLQIPGSSAVTGTYILSVLGDTATGFSGSNDANAAYLIEQRGTSYQVNGGSVVSYPGVRFGFQKEGTWNKADAPSTGINGSFIVQTSTGGGPSSLPTISEKFRINGAGNVGIGVTSPDTNYKLTTSGGGIKSESTTQPAGYFNSTSGYGLLVNTGNVGIGTVTPSFKLDTVGVLRAGSTTGGRVLLSSAGSPDYGGHIYLTQDLGSTQGAVRLRASYSGGGTSGNPNFIIDRSTTSQAYGADPSSLTYTNTLVIDGSNSSIGIGGVTSPDANYKLTTTAGGVKAENSSATQPAGFFNNTSTGPDLQVDTGGIKFSDSTIQTSAGAAGVKLLSSGTGIIVNGNSTTRNGGATWDAQVYSKDGYTGGAYVSWVVQTTSYHWMMGLNIDPTTDAGYGSIDYAWYGMASTAGSIYESGGNPATGFTFAIGDVLAITYDGTNVKYLQNGIVRRTVAATISSPIYLDSSIYSGVATAPDISNIQFGPFGGGGSSQWATSGSNISYIAGNVGIGTTGPGTPLHVKGSSVAWRSILNIEGGTSDSSIGLTMYNGPTAGTNLMGKLDYDAGTAKTMSLSNYNNGTGGDISINTFGATKNVYMPSGNVGIGTTNPTQKLEVSGGAIKATGGLIIETRTSDPGSPVAGQIWLRTDL